MSSFWDDLRFAVRSYRRRASLTALLLVTLALGIGGTTAIFSLLYGVVLDPLPYEEADRIVRVWPARSRGLSKELLVQLQREAISYEALAAVSESSFSLVRDGRSTMAYGPTVTADYLRILRATTTVGRGFEPGDDRRGPRHAVLSWSFWQQVYGGDPSVVGRTATLNGIRHVVVGVAERGFETPLGDFDLITTHVVEPDEADWDGNYLDIVGRLAEGVTVEQADAELRALALRWAYQAGVSAEWAASSSVITLHESMVGDVRPSLLLLTGATGFLLLIVVANVMNLLLARALAREREMSLRQALGASRGRLARQLVTESVLLALLGGALGLVFATFAARVLVGILPPDLPRLEHAGIVPEVLVAALALALCTGVVVGLAPALIVARRDLRAGLGGAGRQSVPSHSRRWVRSSLVVCEVTLAFVLLAGAGVLVRSFWLTLQVDPGFDSRNLVVFTVLPGPDSWDTPGELDDYYERLREKLAALPGVDGSAILHAVPVADSGWVMATYPADDPPLDGNLAPLARWRPIGAEYLRTAGVGLLAGRGFATTDTAESEPVVIVNETLARAYLSDTEPLDRILGRSFRISFEGPVDLRVVGVVQDVKILGLRAGAPRAAYRPFPQSTPVLHRIGVDQRSVMVRSPLPVESLDSMLRAAVADVDPLANVLDLEPMSRVVGESLARSRAIMLLLTGFAVMALVLGAIGIYGVMGHSVRERNREMGIRLALGAERLSLIATVMGSGLKLVFIGLGVGGACALALNRLLASELFEVGPADPMSLLAAGGTLLGAATLSIWLPARRAGRVDPVEALRAE